MHDFFSRQDRARRRTALLLGYFAVAVILIILAVYLATRGLHIYTSTTALGSGPPAGWWNGKWFAWSAGTTAAIILAGTFYQLGQLRQGGRRLAELLDARRLAPGSAQPQQRQLLNIVEEIAIAAGMPVPEVYVMDRERGINAFAAGFGSNDGIVCVTRGALELLTREELQGVIAHEFSHLLNGDSLINLRLIGWLHGILLLNQVGGSLLRGLLPGRGGRGRGPFVALGLILWLLGYLGYLCGQLIKSAISRQREQLADAAAVQFTRNPLGLAGALKKIGGLDQGATLSHPQAALASHMYFAEGLRHSWLSAFASHPPLDARIRLLDPAFDGRYPAITPLPAPNPEPGYIQRERPRMKGETLSGAAVLALLEQVGELEEAQLSWARRQLENLPPQLREACREPLEATRLVAALLLAEPPETRARQRLLLTSRIGEHEIDVIEQLRRQLDGLEIQARLLLVDLLLPSLRQLSPAQFQDFRQRMQGLIDADRQVSLFEYALLHLVLQPLGRQFGLARKPIVQYYTLRGVEHQAALTLSLLARLGHRDAAAVRQSFAQGARVLAEPGLQVGLLPLTDCSRQALDAALTRLQQTSPQLKRRLLAAWLQCLTADGRITNRELVLFRALAAALEVPVPAWLTSSPA